MNLQSEADFFKDIAEEVRKLVQSFGGKAPVAKHKASIGDYATEVDIAVEKLIVAEIQKRFPGDEILAEEGHSDVVIPDGRIWIIDPICGTTNVGRGLTSFCTNIALADGKKLIAACVVDHSQNDYFWSIGNQEVYINDKLAQPNTTDDKFGVVIDADLGALADVDDVIKKRLFDAAFELSMIPGYKLQSLSTSLGFAYTAVGKVDGFINVSNYPWDICAAAFLILQTDGIITDLSGRPWEISSVGAIASGNPKIHQQLLDAYSINQN